jgi:ATP-dependent protease HslVU (ClpYQ) peptidase subunit
LRKCLREGGYAKKEHEVETGGNFLVGFRGRLFEVQSDYQVAEPRSGIAAIGCGAQIAYGAMFVTGHLEPRMRLLQALRASEFHNAAVRRPFVVKKMETVKDE